MFKTIKIVAAFALLYFVFFGSVPTSIDINPIPNTVDEVQTIINVDKPSEEIINIVKPVAELITEIDDRAKLALFNYEFANRVERYNTDVQNLNDVYVKAASLFFGDSLKGKYTNFASKVETLFVFVVGDDNHVLSDKEKTSIKELFIGLSWALTER